MTARAKRATPAPMRDLEIVAYTTDQKEAVLDLTIETWTPVFAKTRRDVPAFVFDAFYPDGWEKRQRTEVGNLLDSEPENIWLGMLENELVGFLGIRVHPDDQMGEIYIIAVSPAHQRKGIARTLMEFAAQRIKGAGMKMIMVETIGDSGHEPARRAYETSGFTSWPVARYFKPL